MGALTEHLTQLRKDILALRDARQGLVQVLGRETEERRADVAQTLAEFSKNLASMARKTKANRLDSLSDLKRTVNGLRTTVHTDLSSIRQAWHAVNTPMHGAEERLESPARQEPEAHLEESRSETSGQPQPMVGGGEKHARKKRKR
jgi:phage-related tail protein